MMAGYSAVLFDLDGTLLDTALDFYWIADRMRASRGLGPIARPDFRERVSDGSRAMVGNAFGLSGNEPEFESLLEEFLDLYARHMMVESRLFDGIEPLLDWLDSRGIKWGIVTNKPERFSRRIIQHLDLETRCASLVCPENVKQRKPDPEALLLACREIGCEPARTLYVGDHQRDIEAGHRAGMTTIGCLYGYIHADEDPRQWNGEHLVHDTHELHALLKYLYDNTHAAAR